MSRRKPRMTAIRTNRMTRFNWRGARWRWLFNVKHPDGVPYYFNPVTLDAARNLARSAGCVLEVKR